MDAIEHYVSYSCGITTTEATNGEADSVGCIDRSRVTRITDLHLRTWMDHVPAFIMEQMFYCKFQYMYR